MRRPTTFISALVLMLSLTGPDFSAANSSTNLTVPVGCTPHPVSPARQEEIFYAFSDSFYVKQNVSEAFTYIVKDYINHNVNVLDGIESAFDYLAPRLATNTPQQIIHQTFSAPYGWVHHIVEPGNVEPTAIVDVYRFNGSCVAEHWDVIQQRPANTSNPHALF
ncbi:Snoal-like polyketide cyclase family protein [Mycena venus]|uniref:Snoal-like polyketide cyclase family protein n=1 Tax=Mycena venus TaxID=2733690 RepID=A0A8H6Z176_9AGAR|nr:Snoal-like polyketide cyclase family protein [Mycena venus]